LRTQGNGTVKLRKQFNPNVIATFGCDNCTVKRLASLNPSAVLCTQDRGTVKLRKQFNPSANCVPWNAINGTGVYTYILNIVQLLTAFFTIYQ